MDIQIEVGELDNHIQKLQKEHQPTESSAEKQDTIENEVSESSLEFYAGRLNYFSDEWENNYIAQKYLRNSEKLTLNL